MTDGLAITQAERPRKIPLSHECHDSCHAFDGLLLRQYIWFVNKERRLAARKIFWC